MKPHVATLYCLILFSTRALCHRRINCQGTEKTITTQHDNWNVQYCSVNVSRKQWNLNASGEHGTQFATGISTGMVHNTPEESWGHILRDELPKIPNKTCSAICMRQFIWIDVDDFDPDKKYDPEEDDAKHGGVKNRLTPWDKFYSRVNWI